MLRAFGHQVETFTVHNDAITGMAPVDVARKTVWNGAVYRRVRRLVEEQRFDVAHFQNTFPLISPAGFVAAQDAGVAVVHSIRNFRLACVNGLFYRDGRPCAECAGKSVAWRGVLHACYRNSRPASAVVATMLGVHKWRGTYRRAIDAHIAISEYVRAQAPLLGLDPAFVHVKPNVVFRDPGVGTGAGNYALFAGRLTVEKGIRTLLAAWRHLAHDLPLVIVGDGPLASEVSAEADAVPWVNWLGRRSPEEVADLMGDAAVVVVPSEWPEPFGRVVVEAYAKGTPVVAARSGALTELVREGVTGFLFAPGDQASLRAAVLSPIRDPAVMQRMRLAARAEYERTHSLEANHARLIDIYEVAMQRRRQRLGI